MSPTSKKTIFWASLLLNITLFIFLINEKGGINYFKVKLNLQKNKVFREQEPDFYSLSELYKIMPRIPNSIVFVGNSLTRSCDWSELFQNSKIRNRGIGRDCAEGVLQRIDEILDPPPSKIFFELGLTDIARGYPPEEILQHFKKIIDTCRKVSPAIQIYIHSVLPVRNGISARHKFTNEDITDLNTQLKAMAIDNHCTYIDLHPHFKSRTGEINPDYTTDGVHLNSKGYQLWKIQIEKYLQ